VNILTLVKAARSYSLLDFPTLFKAMGVKAEIAEIPRDEWPVAFQQAAHGTLKAGAEVVRIEGTMPDGSQMIALMVMVPAREQVTKDSRKTLDALPVSL
jgi:hypothetical protein